MLVGGGEGAGGVRFLQKFEAHSKLSKHAKKRSFFSMIFFNNLTAAQKMWSKQGLKSNLGLENQIGQL